VVVMVVDAVVVVIAMLTRRSIGSGFQGETLPQQGKVEKHPALRVGYVAQHAFHHLDLHLEKTPIAYM
jgi:hypothetical protein